MTNAPDIDDLIAEHGWSRVADPVGEGDAQRVEIETESGQPALLYLWDDERAARRARAAHDVLGEMLFAVPETLDGGPGWLVVEKPGGVPALSTLPGETPEGLFEIEAGRGRELAVGLGTVVRKLHALPIGDRRVGDLLPADEGDPEPRTWLTFSGYVAHQLEWFSEDLRLHDLSEDDVAALASSIGDMRHELSAFHPRNPARICHGQLSFEHVWLDPTGREVVGLTGFERAMVLPIEADIAYLLWLEGLGSSAQLTRSFYEGYGAARTMDVQRRERFYRRLVAFQALLQGKGHVRKTTEELIVLTSPRAMV